MKRLILLLILFVNLQIVITHEDMKLFSYSTASAQHMTREAGDNCHDDEIGWYFTTLPCEGVIVDAYVCGYCGKGFGDDKQARDLHEKECMERPIQCPFCGTYILFWELSSHALMCPVLNESSGSENTSSGGSNGGGGSSGGNCSGGSSGGAGSNSSISYAWLAGTYHFPKDYYVAKPVPRVFPHQKGINDCSTTSFALLQLIDDPMMISSDEEFEKIRTYFENIVNTITGREISDEGLYPEEYKEMCKMLNYTNVPSVNLITHFKNGGEPVLGAYRGKSIVTDKPIGHQVVVIGYKKDNPKMLLCMDPWDPYSNPYHWQDMKDFYTDRFYYKKK